MIDIEADFPAGRCPVKAFGALDDAALPVVLLFPDAFGLRQAVFDMADRIAGMGYRVLLPYPFYRHADEAPLTAQSVLSGGEDRQRLGQWLGELDQAAVDGDVAALIALAGERFGADVPLAATGYCMGGRFALTAATQSERVRFAASFHGAMLAPESGDGVDTKLEGVKARLYVGVAGHDPMFDAAEEGRLAKALRAAHTDHVIETYQGAPHGFAMPDLPMHNAAAEQRHWQRLGEGLDAAFQA